MKPSFKPRARITGYSPQLNLPAKIRFETLWIVSDRKIFSAKFYWLCHFSLFWSFWLKKNKVSRKNFTREKMFDFEIVVLIYVSKHSESIPTKKSFDQNFLTKSFFHYFCHFGQKSRTQKILHAKKFSISRFSVWNTFWNIHNRLQQKNFDQKFLNL